MPADGDRKPAISAIRVVLPAPLGPSRPVTPGPTVMVMPLTATTLPYHRRHGLEGDRAHSGFTAPPAAVAHHDARQAPGTEGDHHHEVRRGHPRAGRRGDGEVVGEGGHRAAVEGVRREQAGDLADPGLALLLGDPLDGQHHSVAKQQHGDGGHHREAAAHGDRRDEAGDPGQGQGEQHGQQGGLGGALRLLGEVELAEDGADVEATIGTGGRSASRQVATPSGPPRTRRRRAAGRGRARSCRAGGRARTAPGPAPPRRCSAGSACPTRSARSRWAAGRARRATITPTMITAGSRLSPSSRNGST